MMCTHVQIQDSSNCIPERTYCTYEGALMRNLIQNRKFAREVVKYRTIGDEGELSGSISVEH